MLPGRIKDLITSAPLEVHANTIQYRKLPQKITIEVKQHLTQHRRYKSK